MAFSLIVLIMGGDGEGKKSMFFFVVALDLCYCMQAFSSCSEQGLLCCGVLASLVAGHRL